MSWTDERVDLLKKLWMEGLSASQIAGELGDGVTRNAVIGKVHRLKLSTRAKPTSSAPRPRTAPRPAPRRVASPGISANMSSTMAGVVKRSVMRTQSVGATALAITEELEVEAYVPPQLDTELFIPEAQRVSLLGLSEDVCKWPIGDPLQAGFHFCGGKSLDGKPYCEFHSRKAYHQLERKKR
jgi:GcrA cell cycle regulator